MHRVLYDLGSVFLFSGSVSLVLNRRAATVLVFTKILPAVESRLRRLADHLKSFYFETSGLFCMLFCYTAVFAFM